MRGVVYLKNKSDKVMNTVYENRVVNRLSQAELAKILGVSRQTIYLVEKGDCNPSLLLAFRISSHFGKRIDDIFTYLP